MSRAMRMFSSGLSPRAPSEPGTQGTFWLLHDLDGRDLVAHQADGLGLRADEDEAALLDPLGKIRVLGQEAIARMDRRPSR